VLWQFDEIQAIRCSDFDGQGTFVISYKQQSSDLIPATATTAQLTELLQAVPGINTIVVEVEDNSNPDTLCTPSGNFSIYFALIVQVYEKNNHDDFSHRSCRQYLLRDLQEEPRRPAADAVHCSRHRFDDD
jgi:hypothetical protein